MYRDWLKGTWRLDTFTATDAEGQTIEVMGPGATGFICYSDDGWMSVQILKAGRLRYDVPTIEGGTDEQALSAARGIFAYAGKFTVDEENAIVYHHLEFACVPNWIGTAQKRYITKESDDVLILEADPTRLGEGGIKRRARLRWVRMNIKENCEGAV